MRKYALALVSMVFCGAAASQDFTSPQGYLEVEGPHWVPLSSGYTFAADYHTQMDNTHLGTPRFGIHSAHWRRDGLMGVDPTATPTTLPVEFRMAHGVWSKLRPQHNNVVQDLLRGGTTTVFTLKQVSFPSWQNPPATAPAPFTIALPFDTKFTYDGLDALVSQFRVGPPPQMSSRFADGLAEPQSHLSSATELGTGCQVAGHPASMRLRSALHVWGPFRDTEWQLSTSYGPPSKPVALGIGLQNPALAIGACTLMYSSHDVVAVMGTANYLGSAFQNFFIRHDPQLVGLRLFVQAFSPDAAQPGLPYAFSQGVEHVYAAPPVHTQVAHGSALGPPWPNVLTMYSGAGIVTGFADS